MSKARDLANAGTALGAVTATELGYVDGVTSAIQTQIDTKAPSSTAVTLTDTQTLTNKTLTNPVIASVINNTLVDAKGDVITATADNTPARLGVGSNNQVLTADSTAATGLKWATISSSPGSATSRVDTLQTTTSTSYAALATAQAVTLTTGTKVLVIISAKTEQLASNPRSISYSISGATTIAASDTWAIVSGTDQAGESQQLSCSYVSYQTVTAGSNTFTMLFKTTGGTATFSNRQITVIDLGS
jgi:hypothetical protein